MSGEIPLREYMDAQFSSVRQLIESKFDAAIERSEFGDKQNAQWISSVGTLVEANRTTIDRLEQNQIELGRHVRPIDDRLARVEEKVLDLQKQVRSLEDDRLKFRTSTKVLVGFVGFLGAGNILSLLQQL